MGEAPAGKPLRFSQAQRLQRSWEFDRARLEGQRIVKGCLILNWRSADAEKGQGIPRLGVVTSRKIGNAVARSRARRLMREVFRHHQHDLQQSVDIVLVARQSIAGKTYSQVELDFLAAAKQARLIQGNR
ncbi:MAG TPA: ribonuclease P protein component [Candidatus Kapabacteria bacterium]|nr:ribonuclease P protein component [Candidatus Kapabacteria bacterium]